MSGKAYDVTIVGAGPAGETAAILLAKKGYQVVLIDHKTFPRAVPRAGWLNALCVPLLVELGVDAAPLQKRPFHDVTFYPADLMQTAKPTFQQAPGFLVDRKEFDQTLVTTAAQRGTTVIHDCAASNIQLKESSVEVALADARLLESKLLLLAAGRDSKLLERLAVGTAGCSLWSAQVDAPLDPRMAPTELRIGVVLGLDRTGSFGLLFVAPDRVTVVVTWSGERSGTIPALISLCRRAFEHQTVPLDLTRKASLAKPLATPASAALDMESHVGKHVLVIGEAGGFVSAMSNEEIYPSMWSAQIAAEVVDRALQSTRSQEELMSFDSLWRIRMADYLRPPNTDLQFLLPLIFTNQPMADRMGAAFFLGETI